MQVERGTGKVRRSKTNVLPLYHATKGAILSTVALGASHDKGVI